ncbi:MAG: DUF4147 domain-containing protein [Phycisphaerales bacterium]
MSSTPFDPVAEHALAMRIVRAVLEACDPRAATAKAARASGLANTDGRWVLAIGKAAIGMAEGLADACGLPDRHLIVTVDGPHQGRLTNIMRSDHPLPTQAQSRRRPSRQTLHRRSQDRERSGDHRADFRRRIIAHL